MTGQRRTAVALWALAGGIAVSTVLGPLGLGIVRFRVSEGAERQLAGGELASLALAVPAATVAGWLWWRGARLAPMLALGPAAYAAYMYTQYVIGPEYGRHAGNNERAFPLYLLLVLLGGAIAVRAWAALGEMELPPPPRSLRRATGALLIATGALFALAWLGSIAAVIGGEAPDEYLRDPQLFWVVRLMDLGAVIPLALLAGVGALRAAPWSGRATIAAMGFLTPMIAAVAGMAVRLVAAGDPTASAGFAAVTVALAGIALVLSALLLRDAAAPSQPDDAPSRSTRRAAATVATRDL